MDRDDVQSLESLDRLALIMIALRVADLNQPGGLFPRTEVRRVLWTAGLDKLHQSIERLAEAGFLEENHDPEGWVLVGWQDRVEIVRDDVLEPQAMVWGQEHISRLREKRAQDAVRQAEYRERRRREQVQRDSDAVTRDVLAKEDKEDKEGNEYKGQP